MKSNFLFKLKNLTLALALIFISNQLIAQSSVGIFFQAVARDNYSNPAKYRKIYIQSSIIQSSAVGTKVLIEEHQANTDVTGMFSISIGNGTRVGGSATGLSGIDWSNGPFYLNLKVAITPLSGVNDWDYTKEWLDMGTTSFGAVPYAFYAANAAGVNQKLNITDTSKMLSVYAKAKALQNLETSVDTKLSISDTASMLIPYIRAALVLDSAYINAQLKSKVSLADSLIKYVTPNMLAANAFDTTTLSNRINSKASASDVANNFTLKLNIADTSLLLQKSDTSSLSNRINLKANSSDVNNNLALKANTSEVTSDLALKANIASPTFTGTVSGVTKTMVGLGNVDNTSDANKPLSTSAQAALDLKANTSEVTSGLALKANIASPTFTGTVSGITKTMVGLGNTDNTSDANKPVSTATQTVLNFKEDITNKSTTTTLGTSDILYPTQKAVKTYVDATVSGATPDADANTMGKIKLAGDLGGTATLPTVPALASKANSSDVTASLALKANLASPTFTGTVSGVTKTMVGLGNADNTSDANKPVSSAAQAAFDLKANTSDVNTALATKVDKVTGKELSTNDYTTAEKTKLAAITGTNTGDQDLSALATNSALALKANTSDVNTALNLKANSADVTSTLNLKANTTDVNTALATKLDKVTGKELSTNDYTNAEKTKLAAITGTNTGDQDLSALATNSALALKANTSDVNTALNLKANLASPTFTGTVSGVTKTMVGLGNVDNTSDANKPVSTAAQTALDLKANSADVTSTLNLKANTTDVNTALATKLDKVTGKELSTNDYTNAEKTKLAAITGTNTGDQDLSALATNTALALKANTSDVNTALNLKLDVTGNASSATKLATTRNINGVAFDGSVDITVTANAGTLTGTTLATNVVNSSLSGVGTITSGTWSGTTIAVAKGGTGTNNGSITGTSALTFAAGGTNENISIKPTGTGSVIVGTGTLTPTSSAALDINSITQGFLPPRLTTTQRDAIITPVAGLTIWNITNTQLEVYDGSYWKNMVGLLVSPLNVGDTYGGGKVFYIFGPSDNGYIKGQTHGLIAATEDQTTDAGVKWFPDKFYGATGTYIGLGLPNTLAIITSAIVTGTTNMSSFAAGLANSYRGGENIDWFLPSKDELNLLYQAREKIGGFATNQTPGASPAYWSSTQKGGISFTNFTSFANGVTSARLQFFNTGGSPVQQAGTITDTGIDNPRRVRAIRIF